MSVNWSWPKATALLTVQAAVHTLLPLVIGHDLLHLNWTETAGLTGSSALVALGGAILAYTLPSGKATAAISAAVGASQDAASNAVLSSATISDSDEARGKPTTLA